MATQGMHPSSYETGKVDIWRKGEPVTKPSLQSFDQGSSSAGMGLTSSATQGVPAGQYQQNVVSETSGGSRLAEKMRTESFAPQSQAGTGTYAAHDYDPNLGYTPYKGSGVKEDESLWQKAKHALTGDTSNTSRDTSRDTSSYRPAGQDESLWQKTKHALGVDTEKDNKLGTTSHTTYGRGDDGMPTKTTTVTTVTEGPPSSSMPSSGGVTGQGMPSSGGVTGQGMPSSGGMTGQGMSSGGMGQQGMPSSGMGQGMPSNMQFGTSTGGYPTGTMQQQGAGQGEMMRIYPSSMQQQGGMSGGMQQQGGGGMNQGHVGHIGGQHHPGQQQQRLEPQSYYATHHTQGAMTHPHGGQGSHGHGHTAEPPIMGHHGPMMQGHHRGEMHEMRQHGGHMQGQRGGEMMHGDMQKDRSALEQQHGAVAGSTGMMGSMPSSGGGGMMQQKDMGMQKMGQPQQRNQLTPQEIDDDQIGRMRQKGYCPLDLIQEPTRYVALFDLPGVYRDQIALCIDRGMLKMTVHRPENAAYPHHKHHRQPQQQESGMTQQPNPQFQGQAQSGGFGKVTVEDEQEDDFDVGVLKGIEHAYQRDMEKRQRAQLQTSQIHDNSGSTLAAPKPGSGMGAGNAGPSAEMRKSPNILPPGGQYLCRERPHGRIDRFIRLPHDIEETLSDAKLENGVLSVSIGRRAHHQRGGQQQMGAR